MAEEYQRTSITTNVITFWDDNGTQLRLSYLENGVSLSFWIPQVSETGGRKYPQELRYSTILNHKVLTALVNAIAGKMMDAYVEGRERYSCAVYTNKARTTIIQVELENGEFFIKYHHNCDSITNIPQGTIAFKFDTYPIMTNYNATDGSLDAEILQVDFMLFTKALKVYVDNAGGMCAGHGSAVANNYRNRKMIDYLQAIANATHASLPAPSYGYNRQNTSYTNTNLNVDNIGASGNLPSPQISEVSDVQDLIG